MLCPLQAGLKVLRPVVVAVMVGKLQHIILLSSLRRLFRLEGLFAQKEGRPAAVLTLSPDEIILFS